MLAYALRNRHDLRDSRHRRIAVQGLQILCNLPYDYQQTTAWFSRNNHSTVPPCFLCEATRECSHNRKIFAEKVCGREWMQEEGIINIQAIGRSRGGLTTKIHTLAASERLAVNFSLFGGASNDSPIESYGYSLYQGAR